jgi:alpha-glucosidase
VHSLYAHGMMKATQNGAMQNNDKRPFILTRGSFAGTGQYAPAQAHTNNDRSWDSLYFGLASVLRSQMFGMPLSGSDVCGYKSGGEMLDEELCLRWYQLATFFPLARHSQNIKGARTEPFNFKTYTN